MFFNFKYYRFTPIFQGEKIEITRYLFWGRVVQHFCWCDNYNQIPDSIKSGYRLTFFQTKDTLTSPKYRSFEQLKKENLEDFL
jgi:hypothetical protein